MTTTTPSAPCVPHRRRARPARRADHRHIEGDGTLGDGCADMPIPNDADGFAGELAVERDLGEVVDEGTFILEEDTKPAKIEITGVKGENAGKKILGIYKLEGRDKLTICYSLEGKAYPEKFDGKGPGMVLITYSRKKVK